MDNSNLPEWVAEQIAIREAEDMAARRKAYDDWARQYAEFGLRPQGNDENGGPVNTRTEGAPPCAQTVPTQTTASCAATSAQAARITAQAGNHPVNGDSPGAEHTRTANAERATTAKKEQTSDGKASTHRRRNAGTSRAGASAPGSPPQRRGTRPGRRDRMGVRLPSRAGGAAVMTPDSFRLFDFLNCCHVAVAEAGSGRTANADEAWLEAWTVMEALYPAGSPAASAILAFASPARDRGRARLANALDTACHAALLAMDSGQPATGLHLADAFAAAALLDAPVREAVETVLDGIGATVGEVPA